MRMMLRVAVVVVATATASSVKAQVIGTFSWQTQPHCNVVTVTVVQQGGVYQLTGSDNLCGAGTAPVVGTAVPAGAGVAFGFTAALPAGLGAHVSATINLATLSGTWADADGNTGPFVFGASTGGSPRPTSPLVPRSTLGPRGLIAQAEVFQSTATFRYARASNGQTVTVTRPFLGASLVLFPGFAGAPGDLLDQTVQVTPAAFNVVCSVVSRGINLVTKMFSVQVNCFNPSTLAPVDAVFFITVIS